MREDRTNQFMCPYGALLGSRPAFNVFIKQLADSLETVTVPAASAAPGSR